MLPARLLRSSGFRIAATFTGVFLIAAAIASTAAYTIINEELTKRHERLLDEDISVMESAFLAGGLSDLRESVDAHASASPNRDGFYLLRDQSGEKLAGNISRFPNSVPGGFVEATALGIDADYGYFTRRTELGDYSIIIGRSAEDISEIDEVFIDGFTWAGIVMLVISLAGAITLSQRMNRRIETIKGALESVSEGKFDTRIPMTGRGDDIDMLAELMNSTVSRLGSSVESIRQISNDISYDLKTPMNRLRINLEEALEKQEAGKNVGAEIEDAYDESNRIISTFDALLRVAQIETRARRARFGSVNLVAVVADITEFYKNSFEDAGMELCVSMAVAVPHVNGDRELLTQLIANLLENAMRHCPSGALVSCTVTVEDQAVVLSVSDNGDGIPENDREKVLRRLYRLEKSRSTPGSGLGLSMVKAIADLHDATLTLEDNKPGLRVIVRLPFAINDIAFRV